MVARQGDLDAVKSHVEGGADINMKDDNRVSIKDNYTLPFDIIIITKSLFLS